MKNLVIGIDTSNLLSGGGRTHIKELLKNVEPRNFGVGQVKIFGGKRQLDGIESHKWLRLEYIPELDSNLVQRMWWQRTQLKNAASDCHLVFIPGAGDGGGFRPYVTMSRNMLPFEHRERERYGIASIQNLKFAILKNTMGHAFAKADGTIFLTNYARNTILRQIGTCQGLNEVIPHGINPRFFRKPTASQPLSNFSYENPLRLLYVSPISPYKHQDIVIHAVSQLRSECFPIHLTLVGDVHVQWYHRKIQKLIKTLDSSGRFIYYIGYIPYEKIETVYHNCDVFVFASSCENMPNTLLEAMASGLPILSSDRGPMPEVLQDGGKYFNPESVDSLVSSLRAFLSNSKERYSYAQRAHEISRSYSWQLSAQMTFKFLLQCVQ